MDWGRECLADFNTGKIQLVLFDHSNNTGAIDVKMEGCVLEETSSFKMLVLAFSSKLNWGMYIISTAKTAPKKIGALICSIKFLSPEVALYLYKSTIWPCMEYCCHVGLVPLIASWNCWKRYKNGYVQLLVLRLLPFLNPWLIVEM